MSSRIGEAGQDLQVTEKDMRELRTAVVRSRLKAAVIGVIVVFCSWLAGYAVGVYTSPQSTYPFSASTAGSLMLARGAGRRMLSILVLGILAIISFFFGMYVGTPSLGVVTYYGSYSRET